MKTLSYLASIAAVVLPLSNSNPAHAGVDYCATNDAGNRVCIVGVYGPRSNRGMIWTLNGQMRNSRFNCYDYGYQSTSIAAMACWSYNAIKAAPADAPEITEVPESVKGIMAEGGFVSEDMAIDLEKVRNAMPPEMK